MNDELSRRTGEAQHLNATLDSILSGLRVAVVVLDRDLRVLLWNRRADDLWGLRGDEVAGQHFFNLDIGLPVEQVRGPIRACLAGEDGHQTVTVEAVNRRGRTIACKVSCTPLVAADRAVGGVIVLMEDRADAPVS